MSRHDVLIYLPSVGLSLDPHSSTGGGGAETQMLMLARGLAQLGASVCIAVAGDDPWDAPDGVDLVRRAPYRSGRGLRGAPREAAEIYATIAAADAEVVLTRVAVPAIALVGWAAKLQRRRFVYSSANVSDFEHARVEPSRRNRALVRHGMQLADLIVVQTDEQRAMCERHLRRTPSVIKSIAAPAGMREHEPEAFLWAGRIGWPKRPLAFVELARAVPEASFRMVCVPEPCEESRELLARVHEAAAPVPNLELLGALPRAELAELIARSVAVVNTSDFEGLSNVFLEAWAQGVPGVALTHDPDGLIGRRRLGGFAGGSAARLASIARELWAARHDQLELAERCQRYVREEHAPDAACARWLEALGLTQERPVPQPILIGAS